MWFLVLSALFSFNAHAGDGLRGGGDVAFCKPTSSNQFVGYYPLGYLQYASVRLNENYKLLSSSKSCNEVLNQVGQRLKNVTPILASGYAEFVESYQSRDKSEFLGSSETFKRKWILCNESQCLNDYKDEGLDGHLVFKLPDNCTVDQQYALRISEKKNNISYITYYLNSSAEKKLKGPLCAFNLVHEWLRDFIPDSNQLYRATFEVFSDDFKSNLESKLGLFQFLPEQLLVNQSSKTPFEDYLSVLSPESGECENFYGSKVCSLEFVQFGNLYGVILGKRGEQLSISLPTNNGKSRTLQVSEEEIERKAWKEVDPGFLTYLKEINLDNSEKQGDGSPVQQRKPAKN